MKNITYQDLERSGMDQRRTIASSGGGLKSFTKDHKATRARNSTRIYASIKRSK